jgi:hypothetical protein
MYLRAHGCAHCISKHIFTNMGSALQCWLELVPITQCSRATGLCYLLAWLLAALCLWQRVCIHRYGSGHSLNLFRADRAKQAELNAGGPAAERVPCAIHL